MPSRNTYKLYGEGQYYHVYNRGVNKENIFLDKQDYVYFLSLFKRHLSKEARKDRIGRQYLHLVNSVKLLSYCLMPNHFHLLLLNVEKDGVEKLMRSIATSYSMYFNRRHSHVGHLFQGVFKASSIESESYLQHISRYIHLNPKDYKNYPYSSYKAIVNGWDVEWLDSNALMDTFEGGRSDYADFVADYEGYKAMLDEIKHDLANDI